MKNLLLNIVNSASGFGMLNAQAILPDALLDQLIKLTAAIVTALLSNWLINRQSEKKAERKKVAEKQAEFDKENLRRQERTMKNELNKK